MKKKAILSLLLCLVTTFVFAQFSALTVYSNSNQKFWLFIDDVLQNEYSIPSIRITGLQDIPYKIRVEMDNPANNCVGQNVLISNIQANNNFVVIRDKANNYTFGKTNANINPIYIQNILLPNYSYFSDYQHYLLPGFNPNANYGQGNQHRGNPYNGYLQNSYGNANMYGSNQTHGNQGYGNQGYGNQGYGNQGYGNQGHGNQGHGNQGHGNSGQGMPNNCMPAANFNMSLSIIEKESFENSKLSTAKQVATKNPLCVVQIMQICRLFSFEQSKLDFAKYAYRFCVDPNNYFLVNEIFTFSATKNELNNFIEGR